MRAVVGLAGAVDLRLLIDLAGWFKFAHDKGEVYAFLGGSPQQVPDRYRVANPGDLLPLNTAQVLLQGADDDQIPAQLPASWAERGRRIGEKRLARDDYGRGPLRCGRSGEQGVAAGACIYYQGVGRLNSRRPDLRRSNGV